MSEIDFIDGYRLHVSKLLGPCDQVLRLTGHKGKMPKLLLWHFDRNTNGWKCAVDLLSQYLSRKRKHHDIAAQRLAEMHAEFLEFKETK